MARVERTVLVGHSAEKMFELVDDVAAYPEFLPWCGATEIRLKTDAVTTASILINYHGLREKFVTRNEKSIPQRMDIHLEEGPFKHMQGHWRFHPLGEAGCKVEFVLEYEFANRWLAKLIGPVFNYIAGSLVEAFVRRADAKFGAT
jgi:ribosome-associated toxin RatA of RatAB toxin-antitoxin module